MHHTSVSALGASYAEAAGFNCAMYSDHFRPWDRAQAPRIRLVRLGAAPQTTKLPFGGFQRQSYRYHPAILTQATATLARCSRSALAGKAGRS
jgi:coenzyme F420-dependent glucose-6-phosphate dehydrogenase